VSAGATPLSNNASFHKKKSTTAAMTQPQSSVSTSGEYTSDSDQGDQTRRKLYRKMSSGEIPPAIEGRSEWSKRVQSIIECARQKNPMKPGGATLPCFLHLLRLIIFFLSLSLTLSGHSELKIVWGGEINSSNLDVLRFGVRLVEDSIYGLLLALSSFPHFTPSLLSLRLSHTQGACLTWTTFAKCIPRSRAYCPEERREDQSETERERATELKEGREGKDRLL
jgi:hypothetical protein